MQESQLIGGERPLRRRGKWLSCLVFGCMATLALLVPGSSLAYSPGVGLADGGATLSYVAGPGEANNVTVDLAAGNYTVKDLGVAVIPDADGATGCAATGNQATCPAGTVTVIRVDLGDGTDAANVTATTPGVIVVRDGTGGDNVTCVAGQTVAADVGDTITGCPADLPPETLIVSGPSGKTPDRTPQFIVDSPDVDASGFECRFDGAPFGPCIPLALGDGPHTFEARALDDFGPDPTPASQAFVVDTTAPDTAIDSGPPSTTGSTSATISFLSLDPDAVAFECKLDGEDWRTCTSPAHYSGLAEGAHTFSVRAVDDVGNKDPTEATISFKVVPGSSLPIPPRLILTRPPASFVLIAGRTITISRKRVATVSLNCSGNKDCAGDLSLVTSRRIRVSRKHRRYVQLGATSFFIPAPHTLKVKVPITKKKFRIVRRHHRIKTMVTVTDRDRAGRTRISTREVFLRAR
jgi:hypothetical protein